MASVLPPVFSDSKLQFAPSSIESSEKIAYEDSGSQPNSTKPILVFIPGMAEFRQTFRFIAPKFVEAGYRALVMDLRGCGQSSAQFQTYTVEDVKTDIISVLDHAKIDTPVVFIGNSFAGAAVILLAAKHPEKVHSIILSCGIIRDLPNDKYLRPIAGILFAPWWGVSAWMLYYSTLFQDKPADYIPYTNALKKNLSEPGRLAALKRLIKATKNPSWESVSDVKSPVLFIVGSKDPDFPDASKEGEFVQPYFSKAEKFESVVLEGRGHYPHAEDPDVFFTQMNDFLNKI